MKVHQREKKKAKFRISFVVLFIIASFATCFTFYMKEDFDVSQAFSHEEEEQQIVVSEMIEEADSVKTIINPVQESERTDDTYLSNILFIGNTQMKGLSDYKIINSENGYFDDNISLTSIGGTVAPYTRRAQYEAIYIMVGLRDLDTADEISDFDGINSLIESVKNEYPSTKVYLVSLLPISADKETPEVNNAKIDLYNSKYLQYANSAGIYYLDLNTMFVGNDGKMLESKTESDGVRLNRDSYLEIGEYILTHIGK